MANWWDVAPVVEGPAPGTTASPAQQDWWASAPVVSERVPTDLLGVAAGLGGRALEGLDLTARTLARGATLGYMDEIAAAANATVGSVTGQPGTWRERYTQNVAQERARDAEMDRSNAVGSVLGQIVGGAMAPLPIWRGAASVPGAMFRTGVTGAGYGAVAGVGNAEGNLAERLPAAAPGAVVGGALGAAVPATIAGVGAAGGLAARMVSPAAREAPAQRLMLRDLQRDAVTPQELAQRAVEAGNSPVALVDLGGPNIVGMGQAVARMPGEGQQAARSLLQSRGGPEQAERVRQTIRETLSGEDFGSSIANVAQRRREEAAPNYARAYAEPLPADPQLERFLADPDIQRGIRQGIESARREALVNDQPFNLADYGVTLGQDGALALIPGATPTRLIDAAKRGLDAMEESARGAMGQATSQSREITNLRRALLERVDALNPAYAQARAAYAGDTALIEAAREGRRLATMRPEDFDVTADELRRMTASEREFFRLGVARGLTDRINSAADNAEATRLRQMFGSPAIRERLRATFDNAEDYNRFARTMEQEIGIASTNRAIDPRGGSPTMPLSERRADLMNVPRGPAGASVAGDQAAGLSYSPLVRNLLGLGGADYAAANAAVQLGGAARRNELERNASTLARMMFTTDQGRRVAAAEALVNRELQDARIRGLLEPIARRGAPGLASGGASPSSPASQRPQQR